MAFCSNCGAQVADAEKFCGECGYPKGQPATPAQTAQPQQQAVTPAPPPIKKPQATVKKKKSKKPLIIGGVAGIAVIALAVVLVITNGFGLFGKIGGGGDLTVPTVSSGIKVEIPGGASADEKAAYEYLQGAVETFESGMEYDAIGLNRPAESFYCVAASAVSALRYTADCLLGEESDPAEWDKIASMCWQTPTAYFFEGLVCEAQGKTDKAADSWAKAAVNPVFKGGADELKCIANIKGDALQRLRDEAARIENEMSALYQPEYFTIPRHEKNFDPVYLAEQALKLLNENEPDNAGALAYYRAALSVNPFGGYNYAGLVAVYISLGDGDAAEAYLKEGLIIDPENETLNALVNKLKEV